MNLRFFVKKYFLTILLTILFAAGLVYTFVTAYEPEHQFIRGHYGTHCYPKEDYPSSIKYVLKFESLDKCLNSIPKK